MKISKWLLNLIALCAILRAQPIPLLWTENASGHNRYHISKEYSIPVRGTEDQAVTLEWLDLQSAGMTEASLELALRVKGKHSLYVMVIFFDSDSNAVFGQTFYSKNGPTLAETHHHLQAVPLYPKKIGEDRYILRGSRSVFLHQTLIDNIPAAGILPVSYCTVQIFHLMAG